MAFASRGSRESYVQVLLRRMLAAGLDETDVIPIDSLTAQKRLVEAGFGLAMVAQSSLQEEIARGTLKVLNVPALRAHIPVTIVHRRNGYLSPAARALMAAITLMPSRQRD